MRQSIVRMLADTVSFTFSRNKPDVRDMVLSPLEALSEIKKRASDHALRARVVEYLSNDIPEYCREGPIIYTARYIASPNFETLRFLHVTEPLEMKTVITEDTRDIFVPQNEVKKALCKLPVCRRITQKEGRVYEHYRKISIADIPAAENKPFSDIKTLWGESLVSFHGNLLSQYMRGGIQIYDDTAWIDRNGRGNLLELYKKFLALFLVHGIFFEDFTMEDEYEIKFTSEVVRPAFRFVEKRFGCRPIIAHLIPNSVESNLFWISYPSRILEVLNDKMRGLRKP